MKINLHDYQIEGAKLIIAKKRVGLFFKQGRGKTLTCLLALSHIIKKKKATRILVVSTYNVSKQVWPEQIDQYNALYGTKITYSVVMGTEIQRDKAAAKRAHIYIINKENFAWLVKRRQNDWKWDALVLDESTFLKHSTSGVYKAMVKVAFFMKYVVLMTGTPKSDNFEDLWSQIYLLDKGERLGSSLHKYRIRYMRRGSDFRKWYPRKGSTEKVSQAVSDIVMVKKGKDDPIYYEDRIIPANEEFKVLQEELVARGQLMLDGEAVETKVAANVGNKLSQLANGFLYGEQGAEAPILVHDLKIKALKTILKNTKSNILLGVNFRADMERIGKEIPEAVIFDKKANISERWNKGKIRLLVCHPKSVGHGLNLQFGGDTIVWYSIPTSNELYQQLNSRIHGRMGHYNEVRVIHLMLEGSIADKALKSAVNQKEGRQTLFLDTILNVLRG